METRSVRDKSNTEHTLPLSSLQLIAPPLRLVSAAMWQVMKNRDVLHYGTLADFVTSLSENVPKLLSCRHETRLTLGLRAQLVLQLCRAQAPPDPSVVLPQLDKIKALTARPQYSLRRDVKVEASVSNFHSLVHSLLASPAECSHFFQEVFPVEFGPQFDKSLEKLLWEFLIRLDQLLPVPSLTQTVSWISAAPAVLEECVQSVSEPQLLTTLLQHQKCLGHLDEIGNLSSSLGDNILSSLSLPPSGKVCSETHLTNSCSPKECQEDSAVSNLPDCGQVDKVLLTEPVIKLTRHTSQTTPTLSTEEESDKITDRSSLFANNGKLTKDESKMVKGKQTKRKHQYEEEEVADEGKVQRGILSKDSSRQEEQLKTEFMENPAPGQVQTLSEKVSASLIMRHQPRVVLRRLCLADSTLSPIPALQSPACGTRVTTSPVKQVMDSSGCATNPKLLRKCTMATPLEDSPEPAERENGVDTLTSGSGSLVVTPKRQGRGRPSPSPAKSDVIFDSEDEDTKNFKDRLFARRYYRTKHNTYVPTLREFLRPRMAQLGQSSHRLGWR